MKKFKLVIFTMLISFTLSVSAFADVLYSDDFESYTSGSFPESGGWQLRYGGAGDSFQYIDDSHSVSGIQSLHLVGSSCWAANVYHPVDNLSNVSLEADVFVNELVSCGCTSSLAEIGFMNPQLATWGTYFSAVIFACDGNVYARPATNDSSKDILLIAYNPGSWYRVQIDVDLTARTFDVYLDGNLLQSGIQVLDDGMPTGVQISAGHGGNPTVWFDDIEVSSLVSNSLAQPLDDQTPDVMSGRAIGKCLFGGFCARSGKTKAHSGIDYNVPAGTPVYSICDGVVLTARDEHMNIWNRFTIINHSNCEGYDNLFAYYGHITPTVKRYAWSGTGTPPSSDICKDKDPDVFPWCVKKGQQIGVVSSWITGGGDNAHLHFGLNSNYLSSKWGYSETETVTASDCLESSVNTRRDALFNQGWVDPAVVGAESWWSPFTLKGRARPANCNAPEQLYIPYPIGTSLPYYPWIK